MIEAIKVHGNKGRKFSEEHKRMLSIRKIGSKQSPEHVAKRVAKLLGNKSRTGQKQSIEERIKKSVALKGEKSPFWKGGNRTENLKIRNSIEMRLWREAVFARDNWICQECRQRGGTLNADHIKPFALYPGLRFAIDNGRTLCKPCHLKTDTWGNPRGKKRLLTINVPLNK